MKTRHIASGIAATIGLLGALGITGCGAEGADEGAIESQSQNLSNAAPSATTAASIGAGRFKAASCVINDGGQDKLLVAGGFNSSGNALNTITVYDPIANTWSTPAATLTNARGALVGIKTGASSCVFIGGRDTETVAGSTAVKDVDQISVASGTFSKTALKSLNVARSDAQVSTCGTQLIVFGGRDDSNDGLRSIEVADSLAPNASTGTWTNTANALNTKRFEFGFVKDPNGDRYLLAAGGNLANARLNTLEVVTTSSCAPTATQSAASAINTVVGPVAFFEGSTDKFVVAGGDLGSNSASAKAYEVSVNWVAGPPTMTVSDANTPDLSIGVYLPTVVRSYSGTHIAHMVLGGDNVDSSPSSDRNTPLTNAIQQYQDAYNWHSATLSGSGHVGGVAELIDGAVYFVGGKSIVNGAAATYPTVMELITP